MVRTIYAVIYKDETGQRIEVPHALYDWATIEYDRLKFQERRSGVRLLKISESENGTQIEELRP